tara:strand:- start:1840 stop:2946 length:1107 start_codon:yes stop_codon:yes gene_type:complete
MFKKFLSIVFLLVLINACSYDRTDDPISLVDNFDRGSMLTNLSDNIIIPSYEDFATNMTLMKSAGQTFTANPTQNTLTQFRSSWLNAYKSWQRIEMFNIGKAEELQYSYYMNVYPLTVEDVQNNIVNGGYDLNSVNNQDAQGFPALDYLLYGVGANDTEILEKYTTNSNATGFRTYLTDVINQMDGLTQQLVNDWTGSYRDTFVNNSGNSGTSSVNVLVNVYVNYYERMLRANKFGIPAGVFSGNPLADKVEGLYSGEFSKDLALEALKAFEDFFNGKAYGGTSTVESFNTYLVYLERDDIVTSITSQLNLVESQVSGLLDNFNQQVITDNSQMLMAYDELQKVVTFIKNDMPNAFNVSITFEDNDGD